MGIRIERIERNKAKKEMCWIYLEDGQKFLLCIDLVVKYNLRKGKVVDRKELEKWQEEEEASKSFDAALNYLSFRPRSKKEMENYLYKKGFSEAAVESTLNKLENYGYIDDFEFASSWTKSRLNNRPMSKRMIAYELYQKGIDRSVIDAVLERVDEEDEEKAAFLLAEKYFKRYQRFEEKQKLYKVGQALARRGFDWGLIQRVCSKLTDLEEGE